MRVGGIQIVAFHANLFINTGKDTTEDAKKFAKLRNQVRKKSWNNVREGDEILLMRWGGAQYPFAIHKTMDYIFSIKISILL